MTTVLAPEPRRAAHVIQSADQAISVAAELAAAFATTAAERDHDRRLPAEELEALSESGLLGVTVPKTLGGADLGATAVTEIFRLLGAADGSIAQIPQSHMVFLNGIRLVGTAEQQRHFFGEALAGKRFGNAQAEPATRGGGALGTRLTADGDHYRLSGRKDFCTGALFAQWIPVLAEDDEGRQVVVYVEAGTPGLTIVDDWDGMGQRTTASGSVVLDHLDVVPTNVIPHYAIFEGPQTYGAFAQILHAAIDVGLADGAFVEATRIVRGASSAWFESGVERAAEEPLLIQRFGELAIELEASKALLRAAAVAVERAAHPADDAEAAAASIAVSIAKVHAARTAVATADGLFEVAGTRAAAGKLNLSRHWRDARTHTLHDPTRWKTQHIGRYVLNGTRPPRNGLI